MSSVSLTAATINRSREVFVLYAKKGAFQMEEFADAGAVYGRLTEATKEGKESADVSEVDVKYVISVINVCSQRTPVEAQNFKPIADLLSALSAAIAPVSEVDPADEEEKAEEPSSITEL